MIDQFFATPGNARLWKFVAGLFLLAGLLALTERIWTLAADLHSRNTWPSADGEILSATEQDTNSSRRGSIRGSTRYWVEYEVGFALPASQCRTGIVYGGPAETTPCHGVVRTRSTQSSSEAFQWLLHGYHVHQPVKVLWDPAGTMSTDIKIAGESIWLRYNTDRLVGSLVWVLAFAALYAFSQSRLKYFKTHPGEENASQVTERGSKSEDRQLTNLDLS